MNWWTQRRIMRLRDRHVGTHVTVEAWRVFNTQRWAIVLHRDILGRDKVILGSGVTVRKALRAAEQRPVPGSREARVAQAEACVALCRELADYTAAHDPYLRRFAERAQKAWNATGDPDLDGSESVRPTAGEPSHNKQGGAA